MARETDERAKTHIEQRAEADSLYTRLQERMLEEIQRLSGRVWTDFNAHDPGVTTGDIANYALTELDYKLGFPTEDYLTDENGMLDIRRYGLSPQGETCSQSPVTADDYRRLILSEVPGIENAWAECDPDTGGYTITLLPSPFGDTSGEEAVRLTEELYNSHRNLCEYLVGVKTVKPEELELHAEFETEPGEEASAVLARVYHTVLKYLSQDAGDTAEGRLTEYGMYKRLCSTEGIRSFSTCYLVRDGQPLTDFSEGYSLRIPDDLQGLHVTVRQGRSEARIDYQDFVSRLKAYYQTEKKTITQADYTETLHADYHDVYAHRPVIRDFPSCYRLTENRDMPTSFEAYLALFDKVMRSGLKELSELRGVLSISGDDTGDMGVRRVRTLKSKYLDFLDSLYGVESNPRWLMEQNCYGETEEGTLLRRMRFLRHAVRLTGERGLARDITQYDVPENAPAVKKWFCLLLGLDCSDERAVSNVLPRHNLRIVEEAVTGRDVRTDSLLIDERMLESDNVSPVDYAELTHDEDEKHAEYREMMAELPFFNVNWISGDLFRGGTYLRNYRTVRTGADEYMLIYHNRERDGWVNLGCSGSRERLERLANILRRFLRELNRECETVYIVEPVLADRSRPFSLTIVLPSWTSRFHSPRFREKGRELLRSLVPAHLPGTLYWLDETAIAKFETCYRQLMRSMADSRFGSYRQTLLEAMDEILRPITDRQELDDTD